jgi:hypothetical protein
MPDYRKVISPPDVITALHRIKAFGGTAEMVPDLDGIPRLRITVPIPPRLSREHRQMLTDWVSIAVRANTPELLDIFHRERG